MDTCGPGGDWQNGKRHPGQIIYGQNFGPNWQELQSWGRSRDGQLKNQSSIMLEDYEKSISLTLRTRSSKKTIRNARKKMETPTAPAMPCKTCKKNKHGRPVARLMISSLNLRSGSTRMRMEESLPNYHEDHIAGRGDNSLQNYNLVDKIFLCLKQWKFPQQKQRWTRNGKNWRKFRRGTWQKVRNKSEVIDEPRTNGRKVHFASLMDICHLKNAELETKHQKYKGRSVIRGDIVKDDSGSYAVFTEQGSSASQMTAAKVMDII